MQKKDKVNIYCFSSCSHLFSRIGDSFEFSCKNKPMVSGLEKDSQLFDTGCNDTLSFYNLNPANPALQTNSYHINFCTI